MALDWGPRDETLIVGGELQVRPGSADLARHPHCGWQTPVVAEAANGDRERRASTSCAPCLGNFSAPCGLRA